MMLEDGLVWVDLEMTGLDPDSDSILDSLGYDEDAIIDLEVKGVVF